MSAPDSQGRRVRVFVALHLGAVLAIYGLSLAVGGGLSTPPLPPAAATAATETVARGAAPPPVWRDTPATATVTTTPAWTQRPEVAAPWHDSAPGWR